jgi:DNA primase
LIQKIWDCNTPIILGFDMDKTGKNANMSIGKYLLNLNIDVYTIQNNLYNDLAKAYEMAGKEYIVELIRNAEPFDELSLLIDELEKKDEKI